MADLQKFLDELRAKLSIVDIVGDKVKLIRKGREFSGLCPFHNEKTPSFTVNEAKGFYHCFGCGAHGDIVKFEMEANNLPFMDAVEKLANKAGVSVPRMSHENKEEIEKKNSLYDIMEIAITFFEKQLRITSGTKALDYLYKRGFDDTIISKFRLGYAPNNNSLKALLASKNISEAEMKELGLITTPEDTSRRSSDFFRDRVMIPIFDKRGKAIAFGGRIMGDGQPKYLNSPETPIFNKRRILYNIHNARDNAFKQRSLIICEGYMDVIGMYKYGIDYAVAPLGTALTENQIAEAWKICPEPTLCFDGDNPGIRAANRSVDRALPLLKAGYSLKFAFLPDKLDPDEYLKINGLEAFLEVISDTMPLKDLLWKKTLENLPIETPEQKAMVEKTIKDEIAKIEDEAVRGYYGNEMQNKIYYGIGKGAWKPQDNYAKKGNSNYGNFSNNKNFKKPVAPSLIGVTKTNLNDLAIQYVLSGLICYPELIEEYEEKLINFEIKNDKLKNILDTIIEISHQDDTYDIQKMLEHLETKNHSADIKKNLEFKMIRIQCPTAVEMRQRLDIKIIEEQLRQLDMEIKECKRIMDTSDSLADDVYSRYTSLKKEREAIFNAQNID